ncbi:MAG: hypothetical protein ACP5HZ_03705 [Ferrimicrobium sp.]
MTGHRRSLVLGLVALLLIIGGLGLVLVRSHRRVASKRPLTSIEVRTIRNSTSTIASAVAAGNLACASTTCLVATERGYSDYSQLWVRRANHQEFALVPSLMGSQQMVESTACASAQTCYAVLGRGLDGGNQELFVTNDAGRTWKNETVTAGFEPSSVHCLLRGPCWVTGARNGKPMAWTSPPFATAWSPIPLLHEPAPAPEQIDSNSIACATPSACVDIVTIPGAMIGDQELLFGGVATGFHRVLASEQVQPDLKASCDDEACYWSAALAPSSSHTIVVNVVYANGTTAALSTSVASGTFLDDLSCSATQCITSLSTNKSTTTFLLVGKRLRGASVPSGSAVDQPSLGCVRTSTTCLLTLGSTTTTIPRLTTLTREGFGIGSGLSFSSIPKAPALANGVQLASCDSGSCETLRAFGGHLVLAKLVPDQDRVVRSLQVHDPGTGVAVITPIALTCPVANHCDVIVQEGSGSYQLLSINPLTGKTTVRTLSIGASPLGLSCRTPRDCVMAMSGISHHFQFPVLWTDNAGASWHQAHVSHARNDLSIGAVTCMGRGDCVAIGQHDFVDGYGTLRPFVARSNNGGATWQLLRLAGDVPYSLPGPGLYAVGCSIAGGCDGVVVTSQSTLMIGGQPLTGAWKLRSLKLHPVSSESLPEAASIACGQQHCLVTLTVNPENAAGGQAPRLSVQSAVISPGLKAGPILLKKLLTNAMLTYSGVAHRYLETNATGNGWVTLTAGR